MGRGAAAKALGGVVRLMIKTGSRLSIFPLPGALLLPRAYLPLHIFEPRYRALVSDALARDRRIAMLQPLPGEGADRPALFEVGCVGKIVQVEALEDDHYNLVLEGQRRFRMLRENDVTTPFRQIQADCESFEDDDELVLSSTARASIEREAKRFAAANGFEIDWGDVSKLDDESLVNGLSQAVPFDVAAKQALLEAPNLDARAELLAELFRFAGKDGAGARLQ
jgi:uncharacterized protein